MTYKIEDIKITPEPAFVNSPTSFETIVTGTGLKSANWVTYPEKNKYSGGKWGGSGIGINVNFTISVYDAPSD